jgi:tetratricopeptide (TPR) repeat protein
MSRRALFNDCLPRPTVDRELLERLPHAPLTFRKREYLVSSRTDELAKIIDWIENSAADKRVFWLRGAAGIGKSTLSSHLRDALCRAGRLAAYFFFSRNDNKQEDPGFIIGTLAYQLAHFDQRMGNAICEAIRSRCPDHHFSSQFQARVLNPLLMASFPLPMVIIFDALDEYKDAVDLLDVLVKLVPKMPPNVKLFFTSRPESQIEARIQELKADELGLYQATDSVMEAFFLERLGSVKGWRNKSPSQDQISRLVDTAKGHFVWAATACSVIARPSNGFPDSIVEQILSPGSNFRHSAEARLDSLYHGALSYAFPGGPELRPSLENYQHVLGAILVVQARLNISDLQTVLGTSARVDAITSDLRGLQTRISSEPTSDCPVTPASERFHASFLDFIVDPQRCTDGLLHNAARFRIDLPRSHTYVAQACLQCMNYFFDSEQGKVALYANIPRGLQYALDYWASHVYGSEVISDDLRHAITDFCEQGFGHWFRIQIRSFRGASASNFIPEVDPGLDTPGRLNLFRVECQRHPEYVGDLRQLDIIISVQGVAMRIAADDHPHRDEFMVGMGDLLRARFHRVGRMPDLDAAVKVYRNALTLCPLGHTRRCTTIRQIASALHVRTCLTGALPDLDEAISLLQESLDLAADSPARRDSLLHLAFTLNTRYRRNSNRQDWMDASAMAREAGALCNPSDPKYALLGLLNYFIRSETQDVHDLDELNGAIDLLRGRVRSTPVTHPQHSHLLDSLARALYARFNLVCELHDLDEAIDLLREALRSIPATHTDRPGLLRDLARALCTRFDSIGQLHDLDEAINSEREGLNMTLSMHPDRPQFLHNLARFLETRFKVMGKLDDLNEATTLRRELKGLRM